MRFTGLVFPGQGAQHVGMGADVAALDDAAAEIFERAARVLGFDLKRVCAEGPASELLRLHFTAISKSSSGDRSRR